MPLSSSWESQDKNEAPRDVFVHLFWTLCWTSLSWMHVPSYPFCESSFSYRLCQLWMLAGIAQGLNWGLNLSQAS